MLIGLVLAGCASERAYREGQDLAREGRSEEALERFEDASRRDAGSAQYRIAVLQTREALVSTALAVGRKALDEARYDDARAAFQRAMTWQPGNPRAQEGLNAIAAAQRHAKWMSSAQQALDRKEDKVAENWLRMVLSEDPQHRKARTLLQELEEGQQKKAGIALLAEAYRKPITIEFKDTPLKSVFEVISRTSGLNFLFDKDVRSDQKTSIFLKNSTIEAAVNLTLLTNQLEQRVLDANTVLIYPNTQAKQKDYQSLTVKAFYLGNAEAKVVASTLKTILKSRDVVVDEKLNLLILRDTPEAIRMAARLVAMHDVAESEVMLEVEILEVKRTRLLDLGIRWPDQLSLSPLAASSGALSVADLRGLNSETLGATIGATTINAKKVDADTNILANPRIRVRNREKAKILIGERVPNITSTSTATGFVAESVNYVDVGLKLDVEPTISIEGEVAIKIALEVSSVTSQIQTKSGSLAYQIGTRTAQTILRLKDGENQVLAGLINSEDRQTANKVPGLGEIPVLGRLFGEQRDDTAKTEIVLSITPRILRNLSRPGTSNMEFESGTESSLSGFSWGSPDAATKAAEGPAKPANGAAASAGNGEASGTQSPTLLAWQGPDKVKVGDVFAVQLTMQSSQAVMSLPLAVGFDARSMQVVSVTEGDFLKQGGAQTNFSSRVDPSGQIVLTVTRSGDSGATGSGVVATVNLRATAAAATDARVQLLTVAPVAQGGKAVSTSLPAPLVIGVAP
ncbi:cohesin domain-containing protein [Rhodoferax sp. BAB1]|uniref:cohesin domain-containing protein n=1 Tax=Rhodoferax sp. BAB1 TaxID=2741720 RepID=UPI0020C5D705|nr:cohesin domain-containing protein [Rhodoferax sp. BAB1]